MSSIQNKKQHRAPVGWDNDTPFTCIDCRWYCIPLRFSDEVRLGSFPPKKIRVTVTFDCVGSTQQEAQNLANELVSITNKIVGSTFHPTGVTSGIYDIRIDTKDIE